LRRAGVDEADLDSAVAGALALAAAPDAAPATDLEAHHDVTNFYDADGAHIHPTITFTPVDVARRADLTLIHQLQEDLDTARSDFDAAQLTIGVERARTAKAESKAAEHLRAANENSAALEAMSVELLVARKALVEAQSTLPPSLGYSDRIAGLAEAASDPTVVIAVSPSVTITITGLAL
jgi:hypothetical protein